jgi:pyrroloquinoline quinone (PQQ) biosynthesis protein C
MQAFRGTRHAAHKLLANVYAQAFSIPKPGVLYEEPSNIKAIEAEHLKSLESPTEHLNIPKDTKQYMRWLIELINLHQGAEHPFYKDFMENKADREDLRFWMAQESLLDPRFDDIIALIQVGTAGSIKMEFAKNYWDEMGNGKLDKVHSVLFETLGKELNVNEDYIQKNLLTESLVSGNLSAYYALRRENFYKALGYFGVTEYLAPRRFKAVVSAFQRNNLSKEAKEYHELHIYIDSIHGIGWFNNVVRPLVEKDPMARIEITKGALTRLDTSSTHLDHVLEHCTSKRKQHSELIHVV